jgi:hypothetical protein
LNISAFPIDELREDLAKRANQNLEEISLFKKFGASEDYSLEKSNILPELDYSDSINTCLEPSVNHSALNEINQSKHNQLHDDIEEYKRDEEGIIGYQNKQKEHRVSNKILQDLEEERGGAPRFFSEPGPNQE